MNGENIIYSIGHSSLSIDQFLHLLHIYQIKAVADVRRFPASKKYPHFEREALKHALQLTKIDYDWLGDLLGGFRKGGYELYMNTDPFLQGIGKLIDFAINRSTAFMCAEKLFFRCHRRFIATRLLQIGWKVTHIIDDQHTCSHKPSDIMHLNLIN